MAVIDWNDTSWLENMFSQTSPYMSVQALARKIENNSGQWRKAYTKMRDIEVKRIKRAQAKGELMDVPLPPKLKELDNPVDLARAFKQTGKFLESKRSTAAGRREIAQQTVDALKESGIKNVEASNLKQFGKFMELFRKKYTINTPEGKKMLMDSNRAAEIYDEISERFTVKTNASAMSRAFNRYLRETGDEDLIL